MPPTAALVGGIRINHSFSALVKRTSECRWARVWGRKAGCSPEDPDVWLEGGYLQDAIEMSRARWAATTIMSRLPQELIDRIIDHIRDRKSLKACSLVCSRWSPRSQKHLFVRVEFASIRYLQRWCACIRSGPLGISSLVEHLTLSEDQLSYTLPSPSWLHSSILTNAAPHFQSFSALRALEIRRWRMTTHRISLVIHSFGSSLKNVTRLTLADVTVHPSTLTMFISHFPRLDDLSISVINPPRMLEGTGDSHRGVLGEIFPTHPRGKFSASDISVYQVPEVFKAITLLEPRFHRVTLDCDSYKSWRDYWPLVEACAGSLEELQILTDATGERTHLDL